MTKEVFFKRNNGYIYKKRTREYKFEKRVN
ncbi:hypothetical protein OOU_Y34scaffold00358g1 [Pyricularia oryzae Y34]|uniref:Uncharacterized protein n=1 Tax=Pyricularia oryzae (strain Y34) TaxID=1143189 RepID=A0AA97P299_PYRO3|nr:hypothetical protein OOU_Y34scaffold00358g1 [Pyricularia oryzae Y34]